MWHGVSCLGHDLRYLGINIAETGTKSNSDRKPKTAISEMHCRHSVTVCCVYSGYTTDEKLLCHMRNCAVKIRLLKFVEIINFVISEICRDAVELCI